MILIGSGGIYMNYHLHDPVTPEQMEQNRQFILFQRSKDDEIGYLRKIFGDYQKELQRVYASPIQKIDGEYYYMVKINKDFGVILNKEHKDDR
jgi:hypothetical protein